MSHRDHHHAPQTLGPDDGTPAVKPRNVVDERRMRQPETPEDGTPARRRSSVISESTVLQLSLVMVLAAFGATVAMTWRVSTQVQQVQDRLRVEEKTLRIVAKKVGVEAFDLGPDEHAENP